MHPSTTFHTCTIVTLRCTLAPVVSYPDPSFHNCYVKSGSGKVLCSILSSDYIILYNASLGMYNVAIVQEEDPGTWAFFNLGDRLRVLRCWKFMFLWFRQTKHTNYTIEAMNLLVQYYSSTKTHSRMARRICNIMTCRRLPYPVGKLTKAIHLLRFLAATLNTSYVCTWIRLL